MPTRDRNSNPTTQTHWRLWPAVVIALALGCGSSGEREPDDEPLSQAADRMAPAELTSFTIHVAEAGFLKEEIHGRVAYLFQEQNVVHIRSIHVNFYKKGVEGKETLDAPEGYLYLKDLTGADAMTPGHPFYEKIGGKEANIDLLTSPAAVARGLPEKVERFRRDIDLIGRPARKIVYRRADGTEAVCMRAYRRNPPNQPALLYGVDRVELRKPQPKTNRPMVLRGDIFIANEDLTSVTVTGTPKLDTPGQ